jgi:hypothetical protein
MEKRYVVLTEDRIGQYNNPDGPYRSFPDAKKALEANMQRDRNRVYVIAQIFLRAEASADINWEEADD